MIKKAENIDSKFSIVPITDTFEVLTPPTKINKTNFLDEGKIPIIDQSMEFISGYWNNDDDKVEVSNAFVIFGDHTRIVKYVDFDFVAGADGIKILCPKSNILPKFLFFSIKSLNIPNLGYKRHFRELNNSKIPLPSLAEQEKIVTKLDKAFAEIDKVIIATKAKQKEIEALKSVTIRDCFDFNKKTWKTDKLGGICDVKRGKTITKKETKEGSVPVIAGGVKPAYYHNEPNRDANCITVSGSGNAGFVNFWDVPIYASDCSTIQPLDETQNIRFIYFYMLSKQQYIYNNFRSGALQPHVYAKDIATLEYPLLPLPEQEKIVKKFNKIFSEAEKLEVIYKKQIEELHHLKSSFLRQELQSEVA